MPATRPDIFVIRKSIDCLNSIEYAFPRFRGDEHELYFKCLQTNFSNDRGHEYTFDYELIFNGESKPLDVNGTIFDNKIIVQTLSSSIIQNGICYNINIVGRSRNGISFNNTYQWFGSRFPIESAIIYCIILISRCGADKTKDLFSKWFCDYYRRELSLGELIQLIEQTKAIFSSILDQHPYMRLFYQEAVRDSIEQAKRKLSDSQILVV